MSPRYQLTASAQRDVDQITDFIAGDNIDAALRVHEALEAAFRHLAEMPEMGHTRADLTVRPLKFWSVYSYPDRVRPSSCAPHRGRRSAWRARRREHLEVVTPSGVCVTSG